MTASRSNRKKFHPRIDKDVASIYLKTIASSNEIPRELSTLQRRWYIAQVFHAYIITLTPRAPNPRAICVYESMEPVLHFDAVYAHTQPIT